MSSRLDPRWRWSLVATLVASGTLVASSFADGWATRRRDIVGHGQAHVITHGDAWQFADQVPLLPLAVGLALATAVVAAVALLRSSPGLATVSGALAAASALAMLAGVVSAPDAARLGPSVTLSISPGPLLAVGIGLAVAASAAALLASADALATRATATLVLVMLLSACGGQPQVSPSVPDWRTDDSEPYPFTSPVPALEETAVDGVYTRDPTDPYRGSRAACRRCPPYPLDRGHSTLILDRGRFEMLHVDPRYRGAGHYVVEGDRLTLFNDPECTHERGVYRWSRDAGEMRLEVVEDECAWGQRVGDFAAQAWRLADETSLECQPPDEEAAVTGHWPVPSGC